MDFLLSSSGVIGSRISSEAISSIAIAALMGIGLVARPSIFLLKVNSFLCHFRAETKSPSRIKSVIAFTSAGTMFATTLITPLPPTEASGRVRESSPEIMVISQRIAISLAWSKLPEIIIKVGKIEYVMPTRDILETLLDRFHEKADYQVVVPLELLRQAERTKLIFSIVLGSIAAISLLVGGIGIMNIMLATVSERTREIGIRRALGATKRDIIVQFLSETLILTLAGGLLGIILGSVIPSFVTYFGRMPTVITGSSLALAFGISAAVGVTFGMYPAYRAANMDPIESLRHE